MNIALTGASGFLAGYLINELIESGNNVVLISRKTERRNKYPCVTTDYSETSLDSIFSHNCVDGVVHLAGLRKVEEKISKYFELVEATNNLYDVCERKGINNIVFCSTISVYSGDNLPYKEEQLASPQNMYGLYKLMCEDMAAIYNNRGMCIKNIRLAHIFGANENNNYMINRFLYQAYHKQQINVYCKSTAKREMLYAKDASRAIRMLLQNPELKGLYNIGSEQALTTEEMAKTICQVMQNEKLIVGKKKETIFSSYMSSNKARNEFGYYAQYTFEEAVREIYEEMNETD